MRQYFRNAAYSKGMAVVVADSYASSKTMYMRPFSSSATQAAEGPPLVGLAQHGLSWHYNSNELKGD